MRDRGVEIFTAAAISIGSAIGEEILRMIALADFVAIVFSEHGSANTSYELGVARGLNKPALVFSIGQSLPTELHGIIVRRIADPKRIGEVAIDIDRFLRNAKPPPPIVDDTPPAPRLDLGWARQELERLRLAHNFARGQDFERLVGRLLEAAGAEVRTTNPSDEDKGVDFVVWLNDVAYAFGGPILVECKILRGGSGSVIKNAEVYAKQLSRALSRSDANLGLLIFDHDRPNTPPTLFPTPDVIPFSIQDLIDGLEHGTFEQEVIRRRRYASAVRGVDS